MLRRGFVKVLHNVDVDDEFADAGKQRHASCKLITLFISCPYDEDMVPDELPGLGLTIEADLARFNIGPLPAHDLDLLFDE
jgi:hypothetical protein